MRKNQRPISLCAAMLALCALLCACASPASQSAQPSIGLPATADTGPPEASSDVEPETSEAVASGEEGSAPSVAPSVEPSVTVTEVSGNSSRALEITDSDTRDKLLAWTESMIQSDKGEYDVAPSMGSCVYEVVVMRNDISAAYYFTTMTDEVGRHYCRRSLDGASIWWLAASDSYDTLQSLFS